MTYFPVHAHSAYSVMDGMGNIPAMASRVAALGQPAWAISDHGTMAGTVQGYKESKKLGLAFFPGCEFYLVRDVTDTQTRMNRWHIGMMALDLVGYKALTKLQTLSYRKDRFYRKPIIDLSDLAFLHDEGYSEHIAVTTGCYSGIVVDNWQSKDPVKNATNMVKMLAQWFPHLYVELQDHGIQWATGPGGYNDKTIWTELDKIATTLGLPTVIGGDSHYVHASEQPVHDLMKDICYFGDGEDNHFSGGPYHLLDDAEAAAPFTSAVWDRAMEGHEDLLDKHALTLPALDNYKFHVPAMVKKNPQEVLLKRAMDALPVFGLDRAEYVARVVEEMHVIDTMKMSNYFLLVQEHVTKWCRDNDIIVNTRGSANGSLVCFLLGITTVDPIKWKTSFPRFLSLDRMKPPDIDVDVDFRGRLRLIEHLRAVFPTMVQVGTYSSIGMGKDKDTGEDNGSVIVQYMAAMSRKVKGFNKQILPEHKDALFKLADTEVYKSLGTNAAGFILPGEDLKINDYLPLARVASSDTTVTQYAKDDVEALGYVKIDVLGLRALQTMNGTLQLLGKPANDWDWIPEDDSEACKLISSGNGTGLFQIEGFSVQRGCREMRVKSTLDVILALALYRPALMNGGQKDLYLANRRARAKKHQQRLDPFFDHITGDTLGMLIFQEQVMEVLKAIGMAYAEYNELMSAVKASNGSIGGAAAAFERLEPLFHDLCEDKGLSPEATDEAWLAVAGFTDYGFNRAHATSYGLMAYRSAYLKIHHPLEYMASLMDVWAEVPDKTRIYVKEARRLGISIVRADVNHSLTSWGIDKTRPKALRKGLVSLPGIGEPTADVIVAEREANGLFTDVQDFVDRTPRRPVTGGTNWKRKQELVGVCKVLKENGAFRSLGEEN